MTLDRFQPWQSGFIVLMFFLFIDLSDYQIYCLCFIHRRFCRNDVCISLICPLSLLTSRHCDQNKLQPPWCPLSHKQQSVAVIFPAIPWEMECFIWNLWSDTRCLYSHRRGGRISSPFLSWLLWRHVPQHFASADPSRSQSQTCCVTCQRCCACTSAPASKLISRLILLISYSALTNCRNTTNQCIKKWGI